MYYYIMHAYAEFKIYMIYVCKYIVSIIRKLFVRHSLFPLYSRAGRILNNKVGVRIYYYIIILCASQLVREWMKIGVQHLILSKCNCVFTYTYIILYKRAHVACEADNCAASLFLLLA